jgi:hypothetical protein
MIIIKKVIANIYLFDHFYLFLCYDLIIGFFIDTVLSQNKDGF